MGNKTKNKLIVVTDHKMCVASYLANQNCRQHKHVTLISSNQPGNISTLFFFRLVKNKNKITHMYTNTL